MLQSMGSQRVKNDGATEQQQSHERNLNAITKWKEPIWEDYIVYDANYVTLWKRQSYRESKESVVVMD